jgi:hypothetical protein
LEIQLWHKLLLLCLTRLQKLRSEPLSGVGTPGHALLTVDVAETISRIEGVSAALGDAGAIDIDERVAQWKSSGYNGYDNSAPAYTPDEIVADSQAFAVVKEELAVGKRRAY